LILDRGLFDSVCWLTLMERLERIRTEDRKAIEKLLQIDDWRKRISAVILMTVSPADSMKRERGLLPIENGKGSIMNSDVLQQLLNTTLDAADRMKDAFRIFHVDTSSGSIKDNPKKTAEHVVDMILNVIEEHLQEDILSADKTEIVCLFKGRPCLGEDEAKQTLKTFATRGDFRPRDTVEGDKARIQALPVVVVRNKSGDVLRLKRREQSEDNPLNEKIVIWAGGHVRKEDQANGTSVLQGAVRELQEELRLFVEPEELKFLGAVYRDEGERTSKHVALVYEWRAKTDDVAVALSTAEFFERRGISLSGKFVPLKIVAADVESGKISENWSVDIVRELLAKEEYKFSPRLLL
jgi:predicted NUDIX family phosphoesterase